MKKWYLSTIMAATLSFLCFSGLVYAADECVTNGGFEEGALGWNMVQYSGVTQETNYEGLSCIKLGEEGGPGWKTATAEQTVNLFNGAGSYRLTFYYKNMLASSNSLAIPFVTINGTEKWRPAASNGNWQKATVEFEAESSQIILSLNTARADNFGLYFDNVSIEKVTEFLLNGDFEAGSANWSPLWLSEITNETFYTGASCMKSGGIAGKGGSQGVTSQAVTLPEGTYKLSFYYKNMLTGWNSLAKPIVKINNIAVFQPADSSNEWLKRTIYFSATENESITLTLSAARADNFGIYYDDVSIVPADTSVSFTNAVNGEIDSISMVRGASIKAHISPGGSIDKCTAVLAVYELNGGEKVLKNVALRNVLESEQIATSYGGGSYIPTFDLAVDVPDEEGKTYIAETLIWDGVNSMVPLYRKVTFD